MLERVNMVAFNGILRTAECAFGFRYFRESGALRGGGPRIAQALACKRAFNI